MRKRACGVLVLALLWSQGPQQAGSGFLGGTGDETPAEESLPVFTAGSAHQRCVCVCVCVYVYVYIWVYVYMCRYVHMCICVCVCVYMCVWLLLALGSAYTTITATPLPGTTLGREAGLPAITQPGVVQVLTLSLEGLISAGKER